jgi:RimJ/RimL family protein N-acetyltransferase
MFYKCLKINEFKQNEFKLIPIRHEDRYLIMKWRNEQMYHLRQNKQLTKEDQDYYFENVVSTLFSKEQPEQILFSFLKDGELIGYGGLVHINWMDKNAEISFIMDTSLEVEHFDEIWSAYLKLIEQVGFKLLDLHKIYTYAFDLRPHLYISLEKNEFKLEAILKDHCFINGKMKNVIVHSKIN